MSAPSTTTIDFWRRQAGLALSPDDAHEAERNAAGFFSILARWADEVKALGQSSHTEPVPQSAAEARGHFSGPLPTARAEAVAPTARGGGPEQDWSMERDDEEFRSTGG